MSETFDIEKVGLHQEIEIGQKRSKRTYIITFEPTANAYYLVRFKDSDKKEINANIYSNKKNCIVAPTRAVYMEVYYAGNIRIEEGSTPTKWKHNQKDTIENKFLGLFIDSEGLLPTM